MAGTTRIKNVRNLPANRGAFCPIAGPYSLSEVSQVFLCTLKQAFYKKLASFRQKSLEFWKPLR
jgi:hypothetical protein